MTPFFSESPMRTLLLAPLVACSPMAIEDTDPGTSVGNPNPGDADRVVQLTVVEDSDWHHDRADFHLLGIQLTSCDRQRVIWPMHAEVDLLGGALPDPPLGAWCRQTWRPDGPLVVEGTLEDTPYHIELDLPAWILMGTWEVQEDDAFVMEFGTLGWLDQFRPSLASGSEVDVGPDHPMHDALVDAFLADVGIYRDRDRDGQISDDERRRWRLVVPEPR